MTIVRDVLELLETIAPSRLAASWDNSGLQVGRPDTQARRLLLALDPTPAAIKEAARRGANVLLTHHPLIFRPMSSVRPDRGAARAVAAALASEITVIAAHTNLDAANKGVSHVLARILGLKDAEPLEPAASPGALLLRVPVRPEDEEAVFKRIDPGRDRIKHLFLHRVHDGRFPMDRPLSLLELRVEASELGRVSAALAALVPEGGGIEAVPLRPEKGMEGFGCLGVLETPEDFPAFVRRVRDALNVPALRVANPPSRPIRTVAVLGGSGGSLVELAHERGAEVLISGDLGHHHARDAEDLGLCLIDAGHFGTERPVLDDLALRLAGLAGERGLELDVAVWEGEADPWQVL